MKILCSGMGYDGGKSGISQYIRNMVLELAEKHDVDLVMTARDARTFPARESSRIRFLSYPDFLSPPLINMLWHLAVFPLTLNLKKYDMVFLPAANRRLLMRFPPNSTATVHDLSQLHIPGKYDALRMLHIKRVVPFFIRKAPLLVTVSESTKRDVMEFWDIPGEKIHVIHNGIDKKLFNSSRDRAAEAAVLQKYRLKKEYILYVSRIEHPGKNHTGLLKAYELLPPELRSRCELVFAGAPWSGAETVERAVRSSKDKDSVRMIGYADSADLPALYKNAALSVLPSFYEGFGIPVAEAMACGTPVACSNTSSLPETAGGAARLFDPASPEDMAAKITEALTDSGKTALLRKKGLERAELFDWGKAAEKLLEIHESHQTGD